MEKLTVTRVPVGQRERKKCAAKRKRAARLKKKLDAKAITET